MRERRSVVASLAAWLGVLGLALVLAGVVGANQGLLRPYLGFRLFGFGLLAGVLALGLGLVGLVLTRAAAARPGRGRARLGALLGLGLTVAFGALVWPVRGLPVINDITTDPDDPPRFEAAKRADPGRDLAYPGDAFASQQRAAYPDLGAIRLEQPRDASFERALRAARALGWEVVHSDPARGVFEARQTSRLFRFVDDVVVRVRPAAGGSLVDVRSRSRDGRGDLGANAARIRAFVQELARTR